MATAVRPLLITLILKKFKNLITSVHSLAVYSRLCLPFCNSASSVWVPTAVSVPLSVFLCLFLSVSEFVFACKTAKFEALICVVCCNSVWQVWLQVAFFLEDG